MNKQDSSFALGLIVKARDELWLITSVAQLVARGMLMDPLDYQFSAVTKPLSDDPHVFQRSVASA